jgi:hypothetical protein
MKNFGVFLCAFTLALSFALVVNATPYDYSSLVDWNETHEIAGYEFDFGFRIIDDTNWLGDPYPYTYEHNVNFVPEATEILSATLSIRHWGNYSGWLNPEAWLITDNSALRIGSLSQSGWDRGWVTDSFTLDSSYFSGVRGTDWNIGFRFYEETRGYDVLAIDFSRLLGEYNSDSTTSTAPVPEPSTMLLLGTGLLCLVGIGRRKFNPKE